ncbi:hypothetical protein HD597_000403 [Nonomuraea thailandensis]|uniref:Uncharacterized protein n=1 Tax=Nonomuraea thailandensis TaxID=1188745 RepID=A0A9X2GG01_9ACTN|nr:hypothetical protein [Nonomuraea thailandensis]MCP2353383.1 hypothetical protein [Nonomuraea thailandensis]
MDGKWLVDYFKTPARYPHHVVRGDTSLDPVHISDLDQVREQVSDLVDRLRIQGFALRTENWSGLVVVYGMDQPEPHRHLREALEKDGFTVTVRRNQYGTSLEVHPREADLIMTRFDLIIDTIAEMLLEATDIGQLQTRVEQRLGHSVPTGLLHTAITIFNNSLTAHRQGQPFGSKVPEGMRHLVATASQTGVIPPLCTSQ